MAEAMQFAEVLAKSPLVPKDMRGNPSSVFLAVQLGAEVGLPPMQAIQSIAIINGRPSIYGDGLLALVRASGLLEQFEETFDDATMTATCRVQRKGAKKPRVESFSWADAEKVVQVVYVDGQKRYQKLTDKDTYKSYPKRMLRMRARTFALRDEFADVLRGMTSREELEDSADYEIDVTPARGEASRNDLMPKAKDEPAAESERLTPEQFADNLTPADASEPPEQASSETNTAPAESKPYVAPPQQSGALITEDKRRALFAELKKVGKSVGDLKGYLLEVQKIDGTKAIPVEKFDEVLAWCRTAAREPGQEG